VISPLQLVICLEAIAYNHYFCILDLLLYYLPSPQSNTFISLLSMQNMSRNIGIPPCNKFKLRLPAHTIHSITKTLCNIIIYTGTHHANLYIKSQAKFVLTFVVPTIYKFTTFNTFINRTIAKAHHNHTHARDSNVHNIKPGDYGCRNSMNESKHGIRLVRCPMLLVTYEWNLFSMIDQINFSYYSGYTFVKHNFRCAQNIVIII